MAAALAAAISPAAKQGILIKQLSAANAVPRLESMICAVPVCESDWEITDFQVRFLCFFSLSQG